jgi:hypothetical protein
MAKCFRLGNRSLPSLLISEAGRGWIAPFHRTNWTFWAEENSSCGITKRVATIILR